LGPSRYVPTGKRPAEEIADYMGKVTLVPNLLIISIFYHQKLFQSIKFISKMDIKVGKIDSNFFTKSYEIFVIN